MSVPIADVDSDVVAFLRRAASVRVSPEFDFRSIAEGTELLQPSLKERISGRLSFLGLARKAQPGDTKMFGKTKIALSAAMVLSTAFPASAATKHHRVTHVHPAIYNTAPAARSDDIPTLDVNPVCHGIAMQGELEAGLQKTSFEQCVKSEQDTREQIKKEWSTFTTADKTDCVALAKTGGESSYTELITCMEMARDVRELHKNANALPEQNIPPAPVGHRQPTSQ